jgi:hypothetical protein
MKVQSNVTNDKSADWGYKKPEDGWHVVEMGEGIDAMKDGEGKLVKDKKDNQLWKFPAKINEEGSESHGLDVSIVLAETGFGEKKIADIISAIGQADNFEKAFPGDRSFFESAIMDKIKIKLPGQFCKMRTELSKDGKYSNVMEIASLKFKPEEAVKGKVDKKGAKKEATASESKKESGGDW